MNLWSACIPGLASSSFLYSLSHAGPSRSRTICTQVVRKITVNPRDIIECVPEDPVVIQTTLKDGHSWDPIHPSNYKARPCLVVIVDEAREILHIASMSTQTRRPPKWLPAFDSSYEAVKAGISYPFVYNGAKAVWIARLTKFYNYKSKLRSNAAWITGKVPPESFDNYLYWSDILKQNNRDAWDCTDVPIMPVPGGVELSSPQPDIPDHTMCQISGPRGYPPITPEMQQAWYIQYGYNPRRPPSIYQWPYYDLRYR